MRRHCDLCGMVLPTGQGWVFWPAKELRCARCEFPERQAKTEERQVGREIAHAGRRAV